MNDATNGVLCTVVALNIDTTDSAAAVNINIDLVSFQRLNQSHTLRNRFFRQNT